MTMMLASVRSLDEALIALEGGADLIDLKEPSRGALGALDHAAVRICVQAVGGRRPVSATIGDLPSMDPQMMAEAVERMAATGVDFIKIGFFSHPQASDCAHTLSRLACGARLVAVMFADEPYDLALVHELSGNRFAGVMLDTAHKTGKTLCEWRTRKELADFVSCGRNLGLITGLAGSLRREDIPALLAIGPDYLGFRGALCRDGDRKRMLHQEAFATIRATIPLHAPGNRRAAA
jgi:dihydroneopterin aldolase